MQEVIFLLLLFAWDIELVLEHIVLIHLLLQGFLNSFYREDYLPEVSGSLDKPAVVVPQVKMQPSVLKWIDAPYPARLQSD